MRGVHIGILCGVLGGIPNAKLTNITNMSSDDLSYGVLTNIMIIV